MTTTQFIGREPELNWLDEHWARDGQGTLLILYGRRRVGKTRLLTHWLNQQQEEDGLYWVAEATSPAAQLRSFSQAIYRLETPDAPSTPAFTYATWEQAFHRLSLLAQDKRLTIIIDEVTYLIMGDDSFVGVLQKAWDGWLKNANIMMVLSGSHAGLMQKKLLAYDAPVYGRDTGRMELMPMPFWTTRGFFPNYTSAERVAIYSMLGGIPAYWERLKPDLSIWDNIANQLVSSGSWLINEQQVLLRDFFSDSPLKYISILRGIAEGASTQSQIESYSGLPSNQVSAYLVKLRETGFVVRDIPVTESSRSRRSRYRIADEYLNFFYTFLASHQRTFALGGQEHFITSLQADIGNFIAKQTWQRICGDWLLASSYRGLLPLQIDEVGGFWKRNKNIDLVGINKKKRHMILATCEWQDEPSDGTQLKDLILNKAKLAVPQGKKQRNLFEEDPHENWHVYYIGFSSAGWQPAVEADLGAWIDEHESGNWQTDGFKLMSLEQVDNDFVAWMS